MIAREVRLFLIALQFLTRIRLKQIEPFPDDWLPRCAKYMPLVGVLVGAVVGVTVLAASLIFPTPLPVIIGLIVSVLLTGALHEDGLADTADAFGGGSSPERCLEIMKDSRIGTYGVLALIAVFALKAAGLDDIGPIAVFGTLIAAYAGGRLAAVLAMAVLPYAGGENAKVSRSAATMTTVEILIAAIIAIVAGLCAVDLPVFAVATVTALAAAALTVLIARQKIGGFTGDVLGAVEQVYETTFIVFAAAMIAGPG